MTPTDRTHLDEAEQHMAEFRESAEGLLRRQTPTQRCETLSAAIIDLSAAQRCTLAHLRQSPPPVEGKDFAAGRNHERASIAAELEVKARILGDRPSLTATEALRAFASGLRGEFGDRPPEPSEAARPEGMLCGCAETYPQLVPGRTSHGPGCAARAAAGEHLHPVGTSSPLWVVETRDMGEGDDPPWFRWTFEDDRVRGFEVRAHAENSKAESTMDGYEVRVVPYYRGAGGEAAECPSCGRPVSEHRGQEVEPGRVVCLYDAPDKCPACDGMGTDSGFGSVEYGDPPCQECLGTGKLEAAKAPGTDATEECFACAGLGYFGHGPQGAIREMCPKCRGAGRLPKAPLPPASAEQGGYSICSAHQTRDPNCRLCAITIDTGEAPAEVGESDEAGARRMYEANIGVRGGPWESLLNVQRETLISDYRFVRAESERDIEQLSDHMDGEHKLNEELIREGEALKEKLAESEARVAELHRAIGDRKSHGAKGDAACVAEWIAEAKDALDEFRSENAELESAKEKLEDRARETEARVEALQAEVERLNRERDGAG